MYEDDHGWLKALEQKSDDDNLRTEYMRWLKGRGDRRADFIELDARLHDTPRDAADYVLLTDQLDKVGLGLDPSWIAKVGERDAVRYNLVLQRPTAARLEAMFGITSSSAALKLYRAVFERRSPLVELGMRKIDALTLARDLQHPSLSFEDEPSAVLVEHQELSKLLALRWLLPSPWITIVHQPRFNRRWRERAPLNQIATQAYDRRSATIEAGDPGLVVLVANPFSLVVSVYERHLHENIPEHRPLVALSWSTMPVDVSARLATIEEAVDEAIMMRRKTFRRCCLCGEENPPESCDPYEDVCNACAERHFGDQD